MTKNGQIYLQKCKLTRIWLMEKPISKIYEVEIYFILDIQ